MEQLPTPEQALGLVDQACAQFNGNRDDHIKLQQAIAVLTDLVREKNAPVVEPPKRPKKSDKKQTNENTADAPASENETDNQDAKEEETSSDDKPAS